MPPRSSTFQASAAAAGMFAMRVIRRLPYGEAYLARLRLFRSKGTSPRSMLARDLRTVLAGARPWLSYRCNICGQACVSRRDELAREVSSCGRCYSTVRWRAVIRTLSIELFGVTLSLPDFPYRPDILGLGLSDVDIYAVPLAAKLGYTNTFYHREPRLDIMAIPDKFRGRFDFVISSDVFEHVAPPIHIAFQNTRALLRPSGVLVLTVPFVDSQDPTTEHFPSLHNYQIRRSDQGRVLENVTRDGRRETFTDLTFHEGGGEVLEMRRFTRRSVVAELVNAGFGRIKIYGDADLVHGITWPGRENLPIAAHAV